MQPSTSSAISERWCWAVGMGAGPMRNGMTPEQRKRVWRRIELRLGLLSGMLAGLGAVLLLRK